MQKLLRRLWYAFRQDRLEHDLNEELQFHLDMKQQELETAGHDKETAAAGARRALGNVLLTRNRVRDVWMWPWFQGMSLDVKLSFRMLVKYPGLSLVGGLAIVFAITVGAGTFEFAMDFLAPRLPLDEGDRIVEIRNRDVSTGFQNPRALHDFVTWRDELRSVEEVGVYQTFQRNLITEQRRTRPLLGADMTAAAFSVARVPPLLGRPLVDADEVPGGPNVLVISFDVWRSLFGSDPDVVGETVRLGLEPTTIIGVMPKGFGWPWSQNLWAPFRLNVLNFERGESPSVQVVARLAPGVTLAEAQTELTAVGLRTSADHPETNEHLRPEVVRYGRLPIPSLGLWMTGLFSLNVVFFTGLMLLAGGNVALLLFARTVAREREIVVRSALGASRGRIVMHLCAEALVLCGVAAVVGLGSAQVGLRWVVGVMVQLGERAPFWASDRLSAGTILYAMIFTVFAAVVAGVVPALRVTGRDVQPHLQRAGRSGLEFGRLWTTVIVTQVAVTVAVGTLVIMVGRGTAQIKTTQYGFPAGEYLSVEFEQDRELFSVTQFIPGDPGGRFDTRYEASFTELKRRLADEPGVAAVTVAGQIPGAYHTRRWIEVEGATAPESSTGGHYAQTTAVDLDFFDALRTPIISGRSFGAVDLESGQDVVIVNEDFVRFILEGRNPVGRRLAFVDQNLEDPGSPENLGPWYEIVGVVKQIAMTTDPSLPNAAGIYQLLGPTEAYPVRMVVHVGRDPGSFGPRLEALAADVDPTLQLHEIRPLDESAWAVELSYASWFWFILGTGGIGLLLSTAGIYSIMLFTVLRRTREIGVRVALGADRRRVLGAIFSRALMQVGLGVAAGGVLSFLIQLAVTEGGYRPEWGDAAFLAAYLTVMLCVCMLACIVPARRALAVEPTEALRAEG